MTTPLTPQEIKELAAGYVLGDLSSEEAEQFQKYLAEIPALRAEVSALQEALAMMPYGLPEEKPETQLRSQILTVAQTELTQQSKIVPVPIRTPRFKPRLPWLISSIAAGLAIAFGLSTLTLTGQVRTLNAQLQTQFPNTQPIGPAITISPTETAVEQTESALSWLLQDHQKSLANPNGPVDFVAHQPDEIPRQLRSFQTTVAALPLLPGDQGELLGGSNCQIGKTNGLRLTYQLSANQTVSAYQLDLDDNQFPQLRQFSQFQLTYITLYQPDGTGIVLWRDEDYLYAVVANLPPADLQALALEIDQI
ncbi:MAG: hypothetical protein AAF215_13005 [Cyanobacteria bacterium P01_A01_bin.123]